MTVTWQKNYAGWLGWASSAFLQSDWVSDITAEQAVSAMPVGPGIELVPWNGPFKIVAASVDGIDYERNDGWGGTQAQLKTLHEAFYASKDGMITDFLSGNVDLAFDMTQADFDAVNAVDPAVGKAELDSAWQYEHFDLMSAGGSRLGGKVPSTASTTSMSARRSPWRSTSRTSWMSSSQAPAFRPRARSPRPVRRGVTRA